MNLQPLKFYPTFHYRIWGGNRLKETFNKPITEENIGESWEISTVPGFVSVVSEGEYQGKNLNELIEFFKEKLVGDYVYSHFGKEFPLLIKFIDAKEKLSVQVHPHDDYAKEHHQSFGKNEMWYIMDAQEDSDIIIGFEKGVTKESYKEKLQENDLESILRTVIPKKGEVYYIPTGRVHAIGKNIVLAEIQQTSDVTYRIYDYNRIDKNGIPRELHTDRALEVADFSCVDAPATLYIPKKNELTEIIKTPYFHTQLLQLDQKKELKFTTDSFTILIQTSGNSLIEYLDKKMELNFGETILIPAALTSFFVVPKQYSEVLVVRMES